MQRGFRYSLKYPLLNCGFINYSAVTLNVDNADILSTSV